MDNKTKAIAIVAGGLVVGGIAYAIYKATQKNEPTHTCSNPNQYWNGVECVDKPVNPIDPLECAEGYHPNVNNTACIPDSAGTWEKWDTFATSVQDRPGLSSADPALLAIINSEGPLYNIHDWENIRGTADPVATSMPWHWSYLPDIGMFSTSRTYRAMAGCPYIFDETLGQYVKQYHSCTPDRILQDGTIVPGTQLPDGTEVELEFAGRTAIVIVDKEKANSIAKLIVKFWTDNSIFLEYCPECDAQLSNGTEGQYCPSCGWKASDVS